MQCLVDVMNGDWIDNNGTGFGFLNGDASVALCPFDAVNIGKITNSTRALCDRVHYENGRSDAVSFWTALYYYEQCPHLAGTNHPQPLGVLHAATILQKGAPSIDS
jgi:hypothetical protein